ncbi:hypothetical protein W03_22270 [Nitrosomonas sp. PY1]|uniref:hypothetical protein n=1 Tax=Nitrosomonas sp. PY1 TaxID=1803906 RepID=UPI001FC86654|nr:hypothetical protein [Nitrosomonas sp. PY1]GKS70223.1 hypothetical protein W03_22270 [Nitrosomonas sp. PY1]
MPTNANALREQGANNFKRVNYSIVKRYPPYGKQLDELRRKGLVPNQRIMVTTDWGLGKIFPRIVIPNDVAIENLNFNYLAGLGVQIIHHDSEADLVRALIDEILKVKPRCLVLFNYDLAKQENRDQSAFTVIQPPREVIRHDL